MNYCTHYSLQASPIEESVRPAWTVEGEEAI